MRCTGWRTGLKPGSTERDDADWDAGRDEPKEATSTYRRQTPLAGAVGRLERIRRRVIERAQETTPRSPGPSHERRRLGGGARRAEGGDEHLPTPNPTCRCRRQTGAHPSVRDRARAGDDARIGRIRAQDASLFRRPRAQAASAPATRVRLGGFGRGTGSANSDLRPSEQGANQGAPCWPTVRRTRMAIADGLGAIALLAICSYSV